MANAKWLINQQEKHKEARRWANSAKAVRDATRSFSQEEKAELRRWTTGDWVLRVRARQHKLEPYYDGPFQVIKAFPNNTYHLAMVSGVELQGIYSGDNLFPAYVSNLQPVDSYWYGSKPLLHLDRQRLSRAAGFPERPPPPVRRRADYGTKRGPRSGAAKQSKSAPRATSPKPWRRTRRISRLH